MSKYVIIFENGRWTVNGKKINEATLEEREYMNRFFKWAKKNNVTNP